MDEILKRTRIGLAVVTFSIIVYANITEDYEAMPYMMLCLGILMLVMGIEYFKKEAMPYLGYFFFVAALFNFYVSIKSYLIG